MGRFKKKPRGEMLTFLSERRSIAPFNQWSVGCSIIATFNRLTVVNHAPEVWRHRKIRMTHLWGHFHCQEQVHKETVFWMNTFLLNRLKIAPSNWLGKGYPILIIPIPRGLMNHALEMWISCEYDNELLCWTLPSTKMGWETDGAKIWWLFWPKGWELQLVTD